MTATSKRSKSEKVAASAEETRRRNLRLVGVFAIILAICAAFVLGFTIRGSDSALKVLGLTTLVEDSTTVVTTSSSDEEDSIEALSSRIAEVVEILGEESLDSYDLETMTEIVLEALADAADDPYLTYYNAERYAALMQETSSEYGSIGVLFSEYNGKAYVVDVFEGSAAQLAGVEEGDFVVAIDGDDSYDWTASEVTSALTRSAGEEVTITWRRASSLDDEGGEEYTTTLVCSDYSEANVSTALYEDTVGYIQLKQITSNAADLVSQAIEELEDEGATCFILDLRDNPGGYLTQAVDVASLFVKSGTIVRIETTQSETTKNATGVSTTEGTDAVLVVLVNENTASSAEVIAAALQDNQRATIVGTTTMGKGSVQVTRELSFGGALRYTAAYYKTPNGADIDGVGVVPDVQVSLSDDSDNQLELAISIALSLSED